MHIKSIVAGAAIALAATVGSAIAADRFATLDGVTGEPMNAQEMDQVYGAGIIEIKVAVPAQVDIAFIDIGPVAVDVTVFTFEGV